MKPLTIFIGINIFLLLYFLGCKKSNQPDNIIFTDYNPDSSITSVRTWVWTFDGYLPVPSDSSAVLFIDLDKDQVTDVRVSIGTSYYWVSNSNPHANYTYGSGIRPDRNTDSVAYSKNMGFCIIAQPFLLDQNIFTNCRYSYGAVTYSTGSWNSPCYGDTFTGETYYGIKIFNGKGYNYGWVLLSLDKGSNTLTVKEFAINKAVDRPIKAGQKE